MAQTRGYGEGAIQVRRDGDGKIAGYQVRVYLHNGKRKTIGTFPTRREATKAAHQAMVDAKAGKLGMSGRLTLGNYLTTWLDRKAKEGRSRSKGRSNLSQSRPKAYRTLVNYEAAVKRVSDAIGRMRLDDVRAADIRQLIDDIAVETGARTAEQTHSVLRNALGDALDDELIGTNPAAKVSPPKPAPADQAVLDSDELHSLFAGTEGDWFHALYVMAATGGLREAELLGLSWADVNLDAEAKDAGKAQEIPGRTLHVRRQQQRQTGRGFVLTDLKTTNSKRYVPLIDIAIEALRAHREMQRRRRRELGMLWKDTGRVFTTELGTLLDPANLRRHFYAELDRLGLPRVTIHSLRKTAITAMVELGLPVSSVQIVAGHARSSTTLDIYTKVKGRTASEQAREGLNAAYAGRLIPLSQKA